VSDNLKRELSRFGKSVVQQSRSRLTKGKKNASKDLYNSLEFDLQTGATSFTLTFLMEDYGKFVDKGVSGKEKKYNTPFRYKNKKPPTKPFEKWARTRGLKGRDKKTGRFITRKSLAFALREHVYKKGIRPTLFFTKSFEQQFKRLSDNLGDAFSGDIDNLLDI
jgi:hypothetical protein